MAGYTRQTTFTTGNTIEVADFNNEYNQLLAAFVIQLDINMMAQQPKVLLFLYLEIVE